MSSSDECEVGFEPKSSQDKQATVLDPWLDQEQKKVLERSIDSGTESATLQSACKFFFKALFKAKESETPNVDYNVSPPPSDDFNEAVDISNNCAALTSDSEHVNPELLDQLKVDEENLKTPILTPTKETQTDLSNFEELKKRETSSKCPECMFKESAVKKLFESKQYSDCLTLINEFEKETNPTTKYIKAECLIEQKNFEAASEVLVKVLENSPENIDAAMLLADCYYLHGKLDLAVSTCKNILKTDPTNEFAKSRKEKSEAFAKALTTALEYYSKREYGIAIKQLSEVVNLGHENKKVTSAVLNNRGMALKQVRFFNQALKDFNEVLELTPDDKTIYEKRAICYYKTKQYAECIADCEAVLKQRYTKSIYKLREKCNIKILMDNKKM